MIAKNEKALAAFRFSVHKLARVWFVPERGGMLRPVKTL